MLTKDGGNTWQDITPGGSNAASIRGVFFISPTQAWAVASATPNESGETALTAFSTSDGGENWQKSSLGGPNLANTDSTGDLVFLSFVDSNHGWAMVQQSSSSNFNIGVLYVTADGGDTWTKEDSPSGGSISFVNKEEGWLVGGPTSGSLLASRDGGQTWSQEKLAVPDGASLDEAAFSLPMIMSDGTGGLQVTFDNGNSSLIAWYATANGGSTWSLWGTVAISKTKEPGVVTPSVILPDLWLGMPSADTIDEISPVTNQQTSVSTTGLPDPTDSSITSLSFADTQSGWSVVASSACTAFKSDCNESSDLFATADGGHSWSPLKPVTMAGTAA